MSATNTTKSILSITSPGTHLVPGDDILARNLTAYCNDFAHTLKRTRPEQFGFFASLPLPDVDGSLKEIARAFDELNADGVAILTNHHGHYLGDPKFDVVFDELNRRKAIVFIHPTTPVMLVNGSIPTAATPLPAYPRPMFEFMFESARAIINLFLTGTVTRCPRITFLVAHMGGAFPPIIRRFAEVPSLLGLQTDSRVSPEWVTERLNEQFYFDTAGWPFPEQIQGLLEYVTVDRMLYGSDYCFTPGPAAQSLSADHDKYLPKVFADESDREKLCNGNARNLLAKASNLIGVDRDKSLIVPQN
jgi:predicted TIM-barrel fold metal-dependent hydrolase